MSSIDILCIAAAIFLLTPLIIFLLLLLTVVVILAVLFVVSIIWIIYEKIRSLFKYIKGYIKVHIDKKKLNKIGGNYGN